MTSHFAMAHGGARSFYRQDVSAPGGNTRLAKHQAAPRPPIPAVMQARQRSAVPRSNAMRQFGLHRQRRQARLRRSSHAQMHEITPPSARRCQRLCSPTEPITKFISWCVRVAKNSVALATRAAPQDNSIGCIPCRSIPMAIYSPAMSIPVNECKNSRRYRNNRLRLA